MIFLVNNLFSLEYLPYYTSCEQHFHIGSDEDILCCNRRKGVTQMGHQYVGVVQPSYSRTTQCRSSGAIVAKT
jgi:hypothetical protein